MEIDKEIRNIVKENKLLTLKFMIQSMNDNQTGTVQLGNKTLIPIAR